MMKQCNTIAALLHLLQHETGMNKQCNVIVAPLPLLQHETGTVKQCKAWLQIAQDAPKALPSPWVNL